MLGDSHTEDFQVPRKSNICSLPESKLNNNHNIYNLGISGNSVADYIYYSNSYIHKFNPSKIIIQVTYNDFINDA